MPYMTWIEWAIIAAIAFLFSAIIYAAYAESQRPGFTLKKADWNCTVSHEESTTTYVNTGTGNNIILIPITTTSAVCDQWSRIER